MRVMGIVFCVLLAFATVGGVGYGICCAVRSIQQQERERGQQRDAQLVAAWDEGYNSGVSGQPYTASPYLRADEKLYREWMRGWVSGDAVRLSQKGK